MIHSILVTIAKISHQRFRKLSIWRTRINTKVRNIDTQKTRTKLKRTSQLTIRSIFADVTALAISRGRCMGWYAGSRLRECFLKSPTHSRSVEALLRLSAFTFMANLYLYWLAYHCQSLSNKRRRAFCDSGTWNFYFPNILSVPQVISVAIVSSRSWSTNSSSTYSTEIRKKLTE